MPCFLTATKGGWEEACGCSWGGGVPAAKAGCATGRRGLMPPWVCTFAPCDAALPAMAYYCSYLRSHKRATYIILEETSQASDT